MSAGRVSVVVPAHNAERYLAEALDSVFAQGLDAPEVVVVDDGSRDGTADLVRRYGRGVRLVEQAQSGSAHARNRGIEATHGEIVAFLDSDDLWEPEKSRIQLAALDADRSLGMVFSDLVSRRGDVPDTTTYFHDRGFDGRCTPSSILLYDTIYTSTVMVRRRCLEQVGGFDESLPIGQDTDLWYRLASAFPYAVAGDRPLAQRRLHDSNITRKERLLMRCIMKIWSRYLDGCIAAEPDRRDALLADFAEKHQHYHFVEGCSLLHEGQPEEARRHLREAIALAPGKWRPYAFYAVSFLGPARRLLRGAR